MKVTITAINQQIKKLSTKELKTYDEAYKRGQIYKFARDTARAELKRRKKSSYKKKTTRRAVKPKRDGSGRGRRLNKGRGGCKTKRKTGRGRS